MWGWNKISATVFPRSGWKAENVEERKNHEIAKKAPAVPELSSHSGFCKIHVDRPRPQTFKLQEQYIPEADTCYASTATVSRFFYCSSLLLIKYNSIFKQRSCIHHKAAKICKQIHCPPGSKQTSLSLCWFLPEWIWLGKVNPLISFNLHTLIP